jgi:heat shock protein 1/8
MLKKAEEMKKFDEEQVAKVNAKNGLESYLFAVKNTVSDTKLEGKIPKEDKDKILTIVDDAIKWMNGNQSASKEDYEKKQKEVEEVAMPILSKLQGGMPQGGPGGFPGQGGPGGFPGQEGGEGPRGNDKTDSKGPKFDDLEVD